MQDKMKNADIPADIFRERLKEVIEKAGLNRSAFAESVGLDRSTLSLLLSEASPRLPRASTLIAISKLSGVSLDWLLGLSEISNPGAEYVTNVLEVETGEGHPYDQRLQNWLAQSVGQKVRHIPASLPDLLKTEEVIAYEFARFSKSLRKTQEERYYLPLQYSRRGEMDMDTCCAVQSLEMLAKGQGIWTTLPKGARLRQLDHMRHLIDELYPSFRWFLYDGRGYFSAPLSVYGTKRAALYIGNMYLVFNRRDQIQVLSRHFDDLVRGAHIQPTDVYGYIGRLMKDV